MGNGYITIKIRAKDHAELLKISAKTGVSIVNLVAFAIPKLKSKYRIKDEPNAPKEEKE